MMWLSTLFLSLATSSIALAQSNPLMVPVPWWISNLQIYNIRHGTGGTWQFNIVDTPTLAPQSINTTCHYYYGGSYYFAIDGPPINQPCNNPNVTFSLYPNGNTFQFNITHLWGNCGTSAESVPCNDNGTWVFSKDDVVGQEMDVQNNFGQAGSFGRTGLNMYPKRAKASLKPEFS
ncbi:hypothetical protein BJ878DRAFT_56739 [Calycina marina]|uniref:AA1-like domain-containing protein n=1 Tax=Calycina marina TaxID=1763456 RepID=A0A9P8CF20_9HELO|nr:hypothetical protein BJ878DRAFT_56739 [Calycina marina]